MSWLPPLLAALAVHLVMSPDDGGRRLALALPAARDRPTGRRRTVPSAGRAAVPSVRSPAAACAVAGAALALLLGWPAGVVLGVALGVAGPRVLALLEPRAVREERERVAADLPLALDLLAACLAGGAALPAAVRAVADAVPGPCGRRLAAVSAAIEVGSPAAQAWQALAGGGEDDLAASAVRALVRAETGGAPVADAVARLAAEARTAAQARGQEAAERAGVLAVGPLGLCFLPAFVLLGVVPVVAGLVGPLLAGL